MALHAIVLSPELSVLKGKEKKVKLFDFSSHFYEKSVTFFVSVVVFGGTVVHQNLQYMFSCIAYV